jgi:hypothetical protein
MLEPANTPETRTSKTGRRLSKTAWKPGYPSPNPKGRPKEGQSWAAIIKEVTEMSADDVARMVGRDNDLGHAFLRLPKKIKIKYLVIARVVAALMFEPNSALLNSFMEREDGKVPDTLNVGGQLSIEGLTKILDKAYPDGNSSEGG